LIARHVVICFIKNTSALFFCHLSRVDDVVDHVVHCVTLVIITVEWGGVRGIVDTSSSVTKDRDDVSFYV